MSDLPINDPRDIVNVQYAHSVKLVVNAFNEALEQLRSVNDPEGPMVDLICVIERVEQQVPEGWIARSPS